MAFFACGTRDKPFIRPLRPGTFLYRYSFWAGLASTTSSKVNKPASNFRRSLAERKSWRAELCSAFGMGAPRERAGVYKVYREFRTSRRALNVLSVLRRTVEQESSYAPPGSRGPQGHLSCKNFCRVKSEVSGVLYREIQKKLKIHYIFALTLGN